MRTLLILVALYGTAYAQAPGETPRQQKPTRHKSLGEAYLITMAATSLPMVVAATVAGDGGAHPTTAENVAGAVGCAALVFGPSAGHWYAGHYLTTGLVLRGVAAAGVAALVVTDPHAENIGLLVTGGTLALGTWATGVLWDLGTLPKTIRSYNESFELVPVVTQQSQGVALVGTF